MQQNEVISRSGTEHFLRLLKKKFPKTKQRKRFSFVEMRGPILFLGYFEALYLYQLFTDDYQLQGETMIFFLTMLTKQTSVSRVRSPIPNRRYRGCIIEIKDLLQIYTESEVSFFLTTAPQRVRSLLYNRMQSYAYTYSHTVTDSSEKVC